MKKLLSLVLSLSMLAVLGAGVTGCSKGDKKDGTTVKDTVKETVKDTVKEAVKDTIKKEKA